MVYVADRKYACETCIKGHRSSSCKHTDRPLFEIKKKGRPVTQCEHCRELRKTRQIHVKCVCENKDNNFPETSGSTPGPSGQGGSKVSGGAAFPSGLPPELLEASVAPRPSSEGSESEHSGLGCTCKDGASCTCWTPRHRAKQGGGRTPESRPPTIARGERISEPAALVVSAHAGNKRPVLPKPPSEPAISPFRNPRSSSSMQAGSRSPTHGQPLSTPYGRAHEYNHEFGPAYPQQPRSLSHPLPGPSYDYSTGEQLAYNGEPPGVWQARGSLSTVGSPTDAQPSPSLCGCGSTCACPGCLEHHGPNVDPSGSCANPDTCSACLACNILTLPLWPPDTPQTGYDDSQMQNPSDWIQQMSVIPDFVPPPYNTDRSRAAAGPAPANARFDALTGSVYGGWNDFRAAQVSQPFTSVESDCCGGRCKCPPGMCACPSDCCGCCQGCSCSACSHDDGYKRTLTFATSGERGPCCGGPGRTDDRSSSTRSEPSGSAKASATRPGVSTAFSSNAPFGEEAWSSQLLTGPAFSPNAPFGAPLSSSNASTSYNNDPANRRVPASGSCCASAPSPAFRTFGPGSSSSPLPPAGSHSDLESSTYAGYQTQSSVYPHRV